MRNREKNSSYKALCWVFLALALVMVSQISVVKALEFDNVKSYDPVNKEVTVTNAFGFGSDIAKIKLNTPLEFKVARGYNKVAEFTITSYVDYNNALKELDLYDKHKDLKKLNRAFDYKALSYEDIEVIDYSVDCSKVIKQDQDCIKTPIGSHTEQREVWTKLTPADFKKNDVLTIGIFTEVLKDDRVEWIPNLFGVRVDEWAVWTEALNTDLEIYYSFDAVSDDGNSLGDVVTGAYNLTGTGTVIVDTGGKVNLGGDFESGGATGYGPNTLTLANGFEGGAGTICVWQYFESIVEGLVIQLNDADTGHVFHLWNDNRGGEPDVRLNTGGDDIGWDVTPSTATWYLFCGVVDGGNATIYFNADPKASTNTGADISGVTGGNVNFRVGKYNADSYWDGYLDEIGIWTRALTGAEITQIYNEGTGLTYTDYFDTAPNVTLTIPVNDTKQTTRDVTFNWSVNDDILLANSTFIFNDLINETFVYSDSNETTFQTTLTGLSDGDYNWSAKASDSIGQETTSEVRVLRIDATDPVVNITLPVNPTALSIPV